MARRPTVRDVATLAGVSPATVSNVMRARRAVGADLAARVRAAVGELGYVPDVAASRLRAAGPAVAAALVPDLANPFFAALLGGLEAAARTDGVELIVASSGGDPALERARLGALVAWRPCGIAIVPCDGAFAARDVALRAGVPVVLVDRVPDGGPAFDAVGVDNRGAAAAAARHLLGRGHREILAVASTRALPNVRERCEGAACACAAAGAHLEVLETGFEAAEVRARLLRRLAAPCGRPTAVFALSNPATLAALGALDALGLEVPRDVALLGFDDHAWMAAFRPPVSAVGQPAPAMGRAAWDRLARRVAGDASPPVRVELACRLEARASTAGPPGPSRAGSPAARGFARTNQEEASIP